MQAIKRITATFLAFILTVVLLPTPAHTADYTVKSGLYGHGTLSATVDGSDITIDEMVKEGKGIVFTASPSNSRTLQNLSEESLVTMQFEQIPTYAVTFDVVYGINGHGTLSATVDGSGITTGEMVEEGKDIVFTASPHTGYRVIEWRCNYFPVSGNTSNSYTLQNLSEESLVTVQFEQIPTYAVTFDVVYGINGHGGRFRHNHRRNGGGRQRHRVHGFTPHRLPRDRVEM